jgi:hypothetical protein
VCSSPEGKRDGPNEEAGHLISSESEIVSDELYAACTEYM